MENLDQILQMTIEQRLALEDDKKKTILVAKDTSNTLDAVLKEFTTGGEPADYQTIKATLKEEMNRRQTIRDTVLREKQEKKTLKTQVEKKIADLKREFGELFEENRQIEEKIAHPDIPTLLKLMSSKSL